MPPVPLLTYPPCATHLCIAGVLQVSGMRVYTPAEVEAVNGTDVRLKCTFQSSSSINADTASVSWTFRPLIPGREESVSACVCGGGWVGEWNNSYLIVPPPQPTERSQWVISLPVGCPRQPVCDYWEYSGKKCSRSGVMSLFLYENKTPSSSSLSLLWLSKSPFQIPLVGLLLPAATISSFRRHFLEERSVVWWHHGPRRFHHNSRGQVQVQRHLRLSGQESSRCPRQRWRDPTPRRNHRSADCLYSMFVEYAVPYTGAFYTRLMLIQKEQGSLSFFQ